MMYASIKKILTTLVVLSFVLTSFFPIVVGKGVSVSSINKKMETLGYRKTEYYAVIAATGTSMGLPVGTFKLKALYRALKKAPNWKEENIRLLIDKDATRENIINAFEEMARLVDSNDIFLFSWQGHGSEVPEKETFGGPWRDDRELDGTDEVICPYGTYRDKDGVLHNYITDDELGYRFSQIKAKGMFCIFESCLSGGLISKTSKGGVTIEDADAFSEGLMEDLNVSDTGDKDASGRKRVVAVSTLPDTIGRATYIIGFTMTYSIAKALEGGNLVGKALNLGRDPDGIGFHPKDGIISAEEAFKWSRPLTFAVNSLYWFAIWTILFATEYDRAVEAGSDNPVEDALKNSIIPLFVSFCYTQIYAIVLSGHFFLNSPHISDKYLGDLPIVETTDQKRETIEIPSLPVEIWTTRPSWSDLPDEMRAALSDMGGSQEVFDSISWSNVSQEYWPPIDADVRIVKSQPRSQPRCTIEATVYNAPPPYTWDFGDGTKEETSNTTITHTYTSSGKYTITVVDAAGRQKVVTIDRTSFKDCLGLKLPMFRKILQCFPVFRYHLIHFPQLPISSFF
ncbi:MAG: hypothetical protein DRN18_04460 [Thermoplasmata archaeon]|nr:MAG: hypothetical protein DRN18_04460 [Thermoplasmata archaeon]